MEFRTCVICGSRLGENNTTGIGSECYKILKRVQYAKFFKEDKYAEQRKEYNNIKTGSYIDLIKYVDVSRCRSNFKKNFIPSVINQYEEKGFLTKKQTEIVEEILSSKFDMFNNMQEEIEEEQREYLDSLDIEVSIEEVEKVRANMRKQGK